MAQDQQDEARRDPHDQLLELRDEFVQSTTPLQGFMAHLRRHLGAPITAIVVTLGALAWTVLNIGLGRHALDPAPFEGLNTLGTVAALIATILILAGQQREDEAARRISQLTLHMAAETEHKIAKLISLMEEQRRDSTTMHDRRDAQAERMASPVEPRDLLNRLEDREPS